MKKKPIKILFLLISMTSAFFFSCNRTSNKVVNKWTESQKRIFFQDSIAYRYSWGARNKRNNLTDFHLFMDSLYPEIKAKSKYNPFVYAFEEPYIDFEKIDSSINWFRIIIAPCWKPPICIVVEKRNSLTYLTTKITNGQGGYYTGILLLEMTKVFPDTLYDNISSRFNSLNYFRLRDEFGNCSDGDIWFFEGIEKGNYNYFIQSCLYCKEENPTRSELYSIGCYLLEHGNVVNTKYLIANPWEKEIGLIELLTDTNDFKHEMIGGF